MGFLWLVTHLLLWVTILGLGFLLVGALRALRAWGWRLEQVEFALAGRLGLPPGTKAPPFSLRSVWGARLTLGSLTGHRLLLVFSHSSGHPCRQLLGELNRLHRQRNLRVLLVETGGRQTAKGLAGEGQTAFPVLVQEDRNLARRYHVPTMPFAFLIDERGVIRARGAVSNPQHLDLLLGEGRKEPAATVAPMRPALGAFVPRPDDVFIVTYPRSGTTWVQMILYQLTTEGNMDFPHITTFSPWFERSLKDGTAYDALPAPRVFKSHLSYPKIPKGPCKYLYVARDGRDVAVSYYHFYTTHMGFKGTFDDFFQRFLRGEVHYGSWFRHVRGWWEHRDDRNVLFLRYEDLAADLPAGLRRISAFCGLEVAPPRWPGILERCSFAFMKEHESRFDPLLAVPYEQGFQPHTFLRQGRPGGWRQQLSARQAERFDKAFHRRLGPVGLDFAPGPPRSGGPEPCCALTPLPGQGEGPSP
jgi:peroxiredoxin